MKKTLTIEQSARLIELGVDKKYAELKITHYEDKSTEIKRVFTLTDILSILPKEFVADTVAQVNYNCHLNISWDTNLKKWRAIYYFIPTTLKEGSLNEVIGVAPELIDALYQLLIWGIENEYINPYAKSK